MIERSIQAVERPSYKMLLGKQQWMQTTQAFRALDAIKACNKCRL